MSENEMKLNVKEEKYTLKLTEWEIDIISQAVNLASFPGGVTKLASNLIEKLRKSYNGA